MDIFEAIKTRRSIRKWKNKEISNDTIKKIVEACTYAPSSMDSQPWKFIFVKDQKTKEAIAALREDTNKSERNAPAVLVVCVDTEKTKSRGIEDGNIAAQTAMLAAHALGLGTVYLTLATPPGKEQSKIEKTAIEVLHLPPNIRPICSLAIGYPDEIPQEKKVHKAEDVLHYEKW